MKITTNIPGDSIKNHTTKNNRQKKENMMRKNRQKDIDNTLKNRMFLDISPNKAVIVIKHA